MKDNSIELPPLPGDLYDLPGHYWTSIQKYVLASMRAAIEADRKRRGEPVGYVMPTAIKQLKAGGNAIVGGLPQGGDVAVYLAPQPAEPCVAPTPHNADSGAQNGIQATQPAEPVKVQSMRELIADDAYAATFQSIGQYRRALLARYGEPAQPAEWDDFPK